MPHEEMGSRVLPQPPDVATGIVLTAVAGFLGFVAVTMAGLFLYLKAGAPGAFRPATEHAFPQPALQTDPTADLKRLEHRQRAELSGYQWVDRSRGLARIPIDEAMRFVAARGEHAYDPLDQSPKLSDTAHPAGARP